MSAGLMWPMAEDHPDRDTACPRCGNPLLTGQLCQFPLQPPGPPEHFDCMWCGKQEVTVEVTRPLPCPACSSEFLSVTSLTNVRSTKVSCLDCGALAYAVYDPAEPRGGGWREAVSSWNAWAERVEKLLAEAGGTDGS